MKLDNLKNLASGQRNHNRRTVFPFHRPFPFLHFVIGAMRGSVNSHILGLTIVGIVLGFSSSSEGGALITDTDTTSANGSKFEPDPKKDEAVLDTSACLKDGDYDDFECLQSLLEEAAFATNENGGQNVTLVFSRNGAAAVTQYRIGQGLEVPQTGNEAFRLTIKGFNDKFAPAENHMVKPRVQIRCMVDQRTPSSSCVTIRRSNVVFAGLDIEMPNKDKETGFMREDSEADRLEAGEGKILWIKGQNIHGVHVRDNQLRITAPTETNNVYALIYADSVGMHDIHITRNRLDGGYKSIVVRTGSPQEYNLVHGDPRGSNVVWPHHIYIEGNVILRGYKMGISVHFPVKPRVHDRRSESIEFTAHHMFVKNNYVRLSYWARMKPENRDSDQANCIDIDGARDTTVIGNDADVCAGMAFRSHGTCSLATLEENKWGKKVGMTKSVLNACQ